MATEPEISMGRGRSGSTACTASREVALASAEDVDLGLMLTTYEPGLIEGIERPSEISHLEKLSDAFHYRFEFADHWARGRGEFCSLGDGLYVHIMDAHLQQPYAMRVHGPDVLRIRIASDGCGEYAPAFGDPINIDGPGALVIMEPAGVASADAVLDGHNRSVHVYAHKAALNRLYAGGVNELPAALQAFLDGSLQLTVVRKLPLTSALLRCLEDLQGCTQEGTTRRLYIHSKAVELFCLAFEALEEEDGFDSAETSLLTTRGVLKAQKILMEKFASPPALDELAQEVGLSRSGLCSGFRKILGQSVSDYAQDLRMQRALALLNERGSSITQVAYAVGYNHVSSFSVAVQRHFGATPRDLRRRSGMPAG